MIIELLITITQWGDLNQPKGFIFKENFKTQFLEVKLGVPSTGNAFVLEALRTRFIKKTLPHLMAGKCQALNSMQPSSQKSPSSARHHSNPLAFCMPRPASCTRMDVKPCGFPPPISFIRIAVKPRGLARGI